jgi:hypothetical protein
MTLPRELSLRNGLLIQEPIREYVDRAQVAFTTTGGSIRISESADRYVEVGLRDGKVFVDTSNAWADIAAPTVQEVAVNATEIDIQIYVDRGSVEVFACEGSVSITNLTLIETDLTDVTSSGDVTITKCEQLSLLRQVM